MEWRIEGMCPEGVKHYDWLEVTGWPFWPKHHPFCCQRALHGRESSRRQIFDDRKDHKGRVEFLELRDCVFKFSQGLASTSGVRVNDETVTVVKRNARKSEENST